MIGRPKIILAKVGMDGHDRGITTLATWLRNAGMEVVHLGRYRTVREVAMAAIQEDARVIGLSFLGGEHLFFIPLMIEEMKKKNLGIPLVVGGIIPKKDFATLKKMGVSSIFPAGSRMDAIVTEVERLTVSESEMSA
jgi:methylmalonyl-CoA mutase C-terminal domain/subunit